MDNPLFTDDENITLVHDEDYDYTIHYILAV